MPPDPSRSSSSYLSNFSANACHRLAVRPATRTLKMTRAGNTLVISLLKIILAANGPSDAKLCIETVRLLCGAVRLGESVLRNFTRLRVSRLQRLRHALHGVFAVVRVAEQLIAHLFAAGRRHQQRHRRAGGRSTEKRHE